MKNKKIITFIPLKPYDNNCVVCFIQNMKQKEVLEKLKKYRNKNIPDWYDCVKKHPEMFNEKQTLASCRKRVIKKNKIKTDFYFIIYRDSIDIKNPNDMITLAHEVLHLNQFFLPDFLNRDVEREAEAYFHTYIMEEIVKIIKSK